MTKNINESPNHSLATHSLEKNKQKVLTTKEIASASGGMSVAGPQISTVGKPSVLQQWLGPKIKQGWEKFTSFTKSL